MIGLELVKGAALLLSLSVLLGFLLRVWPKHETRGKIAAGLLFGAISVVGMAMPFSLMPGVIFDARSVVLSVAGFWGGPVVGVLAGLLAAAYRWSLAGVGTFTGVLVILLSVALGLAYRFLHHRFRWPTGPGALLLFGGIVHVALILAMLTLPGGAAWEVIDRIWGPVLAVFSPATMFLALILADIDRRREDDQKLKENEARLRAVQEASPNAIFLKDRDGRYVLANAAFCERVGLPLAEVIGKRVCDLRPPEAVAVAEEHDHEVFEGGRKKSVELAIREDDGQLHTYWSTKYPITDSEGNITGLACVSTDISDRIHAELALVESEIRYRTIVETVAEGVWEIGTNGETIFVNDRLLEMFGYDRDEMIGRSFLEFMSDDWRAEATKRFLRKKAGIRERHGFMFRRKDGTELWTTLSTTPNLDEFGRFVSAVALVTDMTRNRQLSERIRKLENRLSQVSRLSQAGELATGFAHQLNQPLAVASLYAQGLIDQLGRDRIDSAEMKRVVCTINEQLQRANDSIVRIRAFLSRRTMDLEKIDLNDVVRGAADLIKAEASKYGSAVKLNLATPSPVILGDTVLLQHALLNLFSNAVEAMAGTSEATRMVEISTTMNCRHEGILRVRDHGPGLDSESQKHLFETFFSTKADGLGVGLAICHSIAEGHGGKISGHTCEGGGAEFEIVIPGCTEGADE